jgi:hypothetical protein
VPDRGATEIAADEIVAPGDDVRSGHRAEFFRPDDARETHEVVDGVPVRPLGAGVAEIGEPFNLRRHLRQVMEFGGGQEAI